MCTPLVAAPRLASGRHEPSVSGRSLRRPELDEAVFDHRMSSTCGLDGKPTAAPIKDLDPEVLTQKGRRGEPDGHTANPAWVALSHGGRGGAGTECHGAQAVEEGRLEATAPGGLHAEMVGAVVSGDLGIAAHHRIVDGHHVHGHHASILLPHKGVVGQVRSGRCGSDAKKDRGPPLFRHECLPIVEDRMMQGDAEIVSGRPNTVGVDEVVQLLV